MRPASSHRDLLLGLMALRLSLVSHDHLRTAADVLLQDQGLTLGRVRVQQDVLNAEEKAPPRSPLSRTAKKQLDKLGKPSP